MSAGRIIFYIWVVGTVTFGLRSLPFILFSGDRKMPAWLERLGKMLPPAIMGVLLVYCYKDIIDVASSGFNPTILAGIIAGIVVAVTYKWKKSIFLSIALGTALNMALIHLL